MGRSEKRAVVIQMYSEKRNAKANVGRWWGHKNGGTSRLAVEKSLGKTAGKSWPQYMQFLRAGFHNGGELLVFTDLLDYLERPDEDVFFGFDFLVVRVDTISLLLAVLVGNQLFTKAFIFGSPFVADRRQARLQHRHLRVRLRHVLLQGLGDAAAAVLSRRLRVKEAIADGVVQRGAPCRHRELLDFFARVNKTVGWYNLFGVASSESFRNGDLNGGALLGGLASFGTEFDILAGEITILIRALVQSAKRPT